MYFLYAAKLQNKIGKDGDGELKNSERKQKN